MTGKPSLISAEQDLSWSSSFIRSLHIDSLNLLYTDLFSDKHPYRSTVKECTCSFTLCLVVVNNTDLLLGLIKIYTCVLTSHHQTRTRFPHSKNFYPKYAAFQNWLYAKNLWVKLLNKRKFSFILWKTTTKVKWVNIRHCNFSQLNLKNGMKNGKVLGRRWQ